jgi:hypothetical protein
MEDEFLAQNRGKDLWHLISERMSDPKENIVAYESFLLDLKPGDIYQRHTDLFESTREIYRIKENILSRLRRDTELLNWTGLKLESR